MVVFDLEGTLFRKAVPSTHGIAPSLWTALAARLGPECLELEEQRKQKWNRGEYVGYGEWVEESLGHLRIHGVTRQLFYEVLNSIEYHPGVREVFDQIRGKYRTALISGGFKAQADIAQRDLGINHVFAACELFWHDDGRMSHANVLPSDYHGKLDFMRMLMRDCKIQPAECAFVGDGPNDVPLAEAVGRSIAFNAAPELRKVATHVVNQAEGAEDFRAVLQYL